MEKRNMAYASDFKLVKMYKNNYIAKYMEVYEMVYNDMKGHYSDEQALASAVATVMIAFTKAAGMDMPGIVTWDEAEAISDEDFKTFVEPKARESAPSGGYNKPSYEKPAYGEKSQGGYQKKQYTGPTELSGDVTAPQIDKITQYLNDNNSKVADCAMNMLKKLDVGSPEELSKQEASDIIGACIAEKKKSSYAKKY
jgi:hypothetical protein